MLKQHVQVFSSDPTLVSYLAHYLQAQSCNIIEKEGKYYLRSSYFEMLPTLPTSANKAQYTDGLGAVLKLSCPEFNNLLTPMKVEECIRALMFVLNGIIKLKYKDYSGLERRPKSAEVFGHGIDFEIDASGQRVYTAQHDLKMRAGVKSDIKFLRSADRQRPSTKKVWNIARKNPAAARALYHYAKSREVVELRKVIEEIVKDTYTGTKKGIIKFEDWKKQRRLTTNIVLSKMEELWAFLHNPEMSHDQALHSVASSSTQQANTFKALGSIMTLQEARDIVHTLLMEWLKLFP
jgi:hypothetical protein